MILIQVILWALGALCAAILLEELYLQILKAIHFLKWSYRSWQIKRMAMRHHGEARQQIMAVADGLKAIANGYDDLEGDSDE